MLNPPVSSRRQNEVAVQDGTHFFIRSARAEDEPALRSMLRHTSEEDIHLRCFSIVKDFSEVMAKRFVSYDTGTDAALVALSKTDPNEIYGVAYFVRMAKNPNTAAFDVLVRCDFQGHGLGYELMKEMLQLARGSGIRFLEGYILYENVTMLQIASELGFRTRDAAYGVVHVTAAL
jgi:acetyltransferase